MMKPNKGIIPDMYMMFASKEYSNINKNEIPILSQEELEENLVKYDRRKFPHDIMSLMIISSHQKYESLKKWLYTLTMNEWLKRTQRNIIITDFNNKTKPSMYDVIWYNRPAFLYAVEKLAEQKLDVMLAYYDSDSSSQYGSSTSIDAGKSLMYLWKWKLEYDKILKQFGRDYLIDLKVNDYPFKRKKVSFDE